MSNLETTPPYTPARPKREVLPPQGSLRAWLIFILWCSASLAGFIAAYNIGLLLPAISSDLSLSLGQQGLLSSATFWGTLVLIVPLTWWASRFSPLKTIIITIVIAGLFMLMQGWAPVFAVLILGRMGLGLATVAIEPSGAVLIQQWFPKHRIVFINGIGYAIYSVFLGLGLLATPFILNALGGKWRITFFILAAIFGVMVVLWLLIGRQRIVKREHIQAETEDTDSPLTILKERDLWIAAVGMLGGNAVMAGFLTFFPTLMLNTYAVSLEWSGLLLFIGFAASGLLSIALGYFVTITGKRNQVLMTMGLIMVAGHIGMTLTGSPFILIPLAAIAWGMQAFNPFLFSVPFHLPKIRPKQTSVAIAFIMVAVSAGTVIGPLIVGYLEAAFGNLKMPLIIVACFGITITVAGLCLRHKVVTAPPKEAQSPVSNPTLP